MGLYVPLILHGLPRFSTGSQAAGLPSFTISGSFEMKLNHVPALYSVSASIPDCSVDDFGREVFFPQKIKNFVL